jgi:LSD1 subclass zinc finger protein
MDTSLLTCAHNRTLKLMLPAGSSRARCARTIRESGIGQNLSLLNVGGPKIFVVVGLALPFMIQRLENLYWADNHSDACTFPVATVAVYGNGKKGLLRKAATCISPPTMPSGT